MIPVCFSYLICVSIEMDFPSENDFFKKGYVTIDIKISRLLIGLARLSLLT